MASSAIPFPNRTRRFTADGAAKDLIFDFDVKEVEVFNETDAISHFATSDMAAGKARKIIANGTQSLLAANGVTIDGGKVTLGTDICANGKVLNVVARG